MYRILKANSTDYRMQMHYELCAGNCETTSKASAKRMKMHYESCVGSCEATSKAWSAIARHAIGTLKTSYRD